MRERPVESASTHPISVTVGYRGATGDGLSYDQRSSRGRDEPSLDSRSIYEISDTLDWMMRGPPGILVTS